MGSCPFPEYCGRAGCVGRNGGFDWRHHGALVIDLRSLDWYRWMTAMLDLVAHPHSSVPYVHTGFSTFIDEKLVFQR